MVFFNYSTMQMAAKIVYYGPGLCGKTTNLQYIYGHTAQDSRGEMVSLETETDRTLFFDLLPIDVGSIAGFNTRIQLYTVPGQVFYNTTRKLVLKGVDGVVFVADSQRPMLQANVDSLKNLEENLGELGLSLESLPIALQYNKRDLPDVCSVEELDQALNRRGWPSFEASAVSGKGVFETLKGISKLTLINLKKRLTKAGTEPAQSGRMIAMNAPPPRPAAPAAPPPRAASHPAAAAPAPTAAPAPNPAAPARPEPAPARPAAATPPLSPAAKAKTAKVDVLAELEKIRKQAMKPQQAPVLHAATPPAPPPTAASATSGAHPKFSGLNGKGEIHRSVELTMKRTELRRARRFLLNLRVEDADRQVVEAIRDLPIEIQDAAGLERVLLQLNVALKPRD